METDKLAEEIRQYLKNEHYPIARSKDEAFKLIWNFVMSQPDHEAKLKEITDAELLQNIYDRADTVTLYGSDLYLRGFQDGLDYMKFITDADIEAWAKEHARELYDNLEIVTVPKLIEAGAKAILNGEIKHIEK